MYTQLVRHSLLQPSHWVLSWFNTFTSAQLPSFEAISRHRSQRLKFDSWIELPSSSHDLGMFEQYCNFSEVEILSACNVMVSELFSRISHSIPSWLIYCLKKKKQHIYLAVLGLRSLRSLRSWLWHTASLVVACELLAVACGTQLPDQGWSPSRCLGSTRSQSLGHREAPHIFFVYVIAGASQLSCLLPFPPPAIHPL